MHKKPSPQRGRRRDVSAAAIGEESQYPFDLWAKLGRHKRTFAEAGLQQNLHTGETGWLVGQSPYWTTGEACHASDCTRERAETVAHHLWLTRCARGCHD